MNFYLFYQKKSTEICNSHLRFVVGKLADLDFGVRSCFCLVSKQGYLYVVRWICLKRKENKNISRQCCNLLIRTNSMLKKDLPDIVKSSKDSSSSNESSLVSSTSLAAISTEE